MVDRVALGYEGLLKKVGLAVDDCITERKFINLLPKIIPSAPPPSKWTNEVKIALLYMRFGLGGYPPSPLTQITIELEVNRQRVNQIIDGIVSELRLPHNIERIKK
jgi:hypothetical protein